MGYTHDRTIDDVDARVRKALAERGFGVLTEIDVKATLKAKIGADVDEYACQALHLIEINGGYRRSQLW